MEGTSAFPGDFPRAFADALERRGVSLAWLHAHLAARGHRVSPAALSYWRSGRSQPERSTSREALVEIERLLRVAPGALVDRLGPSRRPGPRPGDKSVRELFADAPGMHEALRAVGFEGLYDELVEQLRHLTVDVDASGRASGVQMRALMQARRDGARRTPLIVTLDAAGRAPDFQPVAGCSLGRQYTDVDGGVFAAELLVDRAARAGRGQPLRPLRRPADGRAAGLGALRPDARAVARGALHGCRGAGGVRADRPRRRQHRSRARPGLRAGGARDPLGLVTAARVAARPGAGR
jgi:hypothetical protein